MKKFIINILIFFIIAQPIYWIRPLYLFYTEKYKETIAGSEIYHSIKKSKQKTKSKILILGDSVGKQLFDNYGYNDTINSFACNQAISMVGHYILLKNYLEQGNIPEIIYIIYTPTGFTNNLDQIFTFNYFLKPFYKDEYKNNFSDLVNKQIKKIPYYNFSQLPNVLTTNWSPNFKTKDKKKYKFLSSISVEYIKKISNLARENNIPLVLLPTPTQIKTKEIFEGYFQREVEKNNLNEIFKGYTKKIIYLDESYFIDNVHLKKPEEYTKIFESKYIKQYLN